MSFFSRSYVVLLNYRVNFAVTVMVKQGSWQKAWIERCQSRPELNGARRYKRPELKCASVFFSNLRNILLKFDCFLGKFWMEPLLYFACICWKLLKLCSFFVCSCRPRKHCLLFVCWCSFKIVIDCIFGRYVVYYIRAFIFYKLFQSSSFRLQNTVQTELALCYLSWSEIPCNCNECNVELLWVSGLDYVTVNTVSFEARSSLQRWT